MIPFCSPEARPIADRIARERTLLAFDFDGTLAPIVERREDAQMRPETRALLRTAALLYPCAVVSGRSRADVAARVANIPLVAVVGSHGAEPGFGPVDRDLPGRVHSCVAVLRNALHGVRGVEIEDKRFSIAVHYRGAASWEEAEGRILEATGRLYGVRTFVGHAVVNVLAAGAPTKADAIRALCDRERAQLPVYVGDDSTDEEAFRCDAVGISIRVGGTSDSFARYFVSDQAQVDELLKVLVAARARQDGLGDRWEGLVRAVGV
jgi:trehalose 6-phosphate phosphatase